MTILVDLDGVVADFEAGVLAIWHDRHPEKELFAPRTRPHFHIGEGLDPSDQQEVKEICQSKGFFRNLPVIEGAQEALKTMTQQHDVYILTSAGVTLPMAASEKYQWVTERLGATWLSRLIITPAKHMVKGDILIDDKPQVRGETHAEWEHVLYDWPYNRTRTDLRRLTWTDWETVLNEGIDI